MNWRRRISPLEMCNAQSLALCDQRQARDWGSKFGLPMSALGHKRTFAVQKGMSALPPKADMCSATRDVRFVPIADSCMQQTSLFDHLVGARRLACSGHGEAERLGGLQVDVQLDFGGLLDRQVGGLVALENPAGIDAGQAICVRNVRSVAQQTSGRGELAIVGRSLAPRGGPSARQAVRSGS